MSRTALIRSRRRAALAAVAVVVGSVPSVAPAAVDNMVFYFNKTASTDGAAIGAYTYDAANDEFWTAGFGASGKIRNLVGGVGTTALSEGNWFRFTRSDNVPAGSEQPTWQGGQFTVGGMALNPASITIAGQTYAAGTLMLINDGAGIVDSNPLSGATNVTPEPTHTKRLYWFNLTTTGAATAGGGTAPGPDTDHNSNSVTDWNDQLTVVLTHADLVAADGDSPGTTSSNLARSFAFSSDGQSIYMLDSATTLGGIYKVNLTTTGSVVKVLDADTTGFTINTEPAVLATSVRNLGFAGTGDQVLVQGSTGWGNAGGLNAFLDNGTFDTTPLPVFTQAQLQAFLDLTDETNVSSVTTDAAGNIYFVESDQSDGVFMYDTQGRFIKIASAAERADLMAANSAADPYGASILDLQVRTNTHNGPGGPFGVTEVLYSDTAFDAPVGITVFKPGDFDRDNDVDADDMAMFLSALATRGTAVTDTNLLSGPSLPYRFDLNGSATGARTVSGGSPDLDGTASVTVDWKDVKVLQTFLNFLDGDTDLDGDVDYDDLDTMALNYYTLGGPANKTWGLGDIVSIDPLYAPTASDANLVDFTDLSLLASTWTLPVPTLADLVGQGYTDQFLTDAILAFNIVIPEPGSAALLAMGLAALRRRMR